MTVKNLRHLTTLADRLENEIAGADSLRVSLCLRTLNIVYPRYDFKLKKAEDVDHRFQYLAPMLVHLESLRVSAWMDEDVSSLVRYFQACPQLHRLSFTTFNNHIGIQSPLIEETLRFTNMTDLNVDWEALGLHDLRIPEPLIDAIKSSPDLSRLELWLPWGWNFPDFLSELVGPLPKLNYLRIGDEPGIDWEELIEEGYSHPMYLFFSQHHIREVHFEIYRSRHLPGIALSPILLQSMFPSLQCFTGPLAIVPSVVSSLLAQQLRELYIVIENDIYEDRDISMEILNDISHPLPHLERLGFLAVEMWELTEAEITALEQLLLLVPKMQSLSLRPFMFHTHNTAELLRCVTPQLRELALSTTERYQAPDSRSEFVEVAAICLAKAFPGLTSIVVGYTVGAKTLVRPSRLLDGSIVVEYNGHVCTSKENLEK